MSDAVAATVAGVLAELEALGTEAGRAGMARFGITTDCAYGVSMARMQPIQRRLKRNHDVALALWATGKHEARILAALTEEPKKVTPQQMDAWVAEFDSWDICDQACSKVFVKTPFVAGKIADWAVDEREYVRRAAFALIAAYAVHGKADADAALLGFLPLIERYSTDGRNFVRKAVNWALRQIGKRSPALHAPALELAQKLAASPDKSARWIGKDAVKELRDPVQLARIAARGA